MGALDSLRREHEVILGVVEQMEKAVRLPPAAGDPAAFLLTCLDFLRAYLEENHEGKEERVLFDFMVGQPQLKELASVLHAEHLAGGRVLEGLRQVLAGPRNAERTRRFVEDFAHLVRVHIAREDRMIFDDVEARLSTADADRLHEGFGRIEVETLGNGRRQRLVTAMDDAWQPLGAAEAN